jgi:hypothetical protein
MNRGMGIPTVHNCDLKYMTPAERRLASRAADVLAFLHVLQKRTAQEPYCGKLSVRKGPGSAGITTDQLAARFGWEKASVRAAIDRLAGVGAIRPLARGWWAADDSWHAFAAQTESWLQGEFRRHGYRGVCVGRPRYKYAFDHPRRGLMPLDRFADLAGIRDPDNDDFPDTQTATDILTHLVAKGVLRREGQDWVLA